MAALSSVFFSTLLLSFALTLFLAGIFGSYFGKGKSRATGFVLALVALLGIGLFAGLTWELVPGMAPIFDPQVVGQSMIAVVAATLGTIVAIVLFVGAVMRT